MAARVASNFQLFQRFFHLLLYRFLPNVSNDLHDVFHIDLAREAPVDLREKVADFSSEFIIVFEKVVGFAES